MKSILIAFILLLAASHLSAQNYWQQEVNTRIQVQLNDKIHMLHGYEEFEYINHSPDTLLFLYIHLWPNAYKSDRTAFSEQKVMNGETAFYFAKPENRGYIDSLEFRVNERHVNFTGNEATPDIVRIDLNEPLLPGQRINVSTPFRVKLPRVFSRLGHTGQAYFISQWFPNPAVYDHKGWHPLPYLDLGEFYSEIGSYEVTITLPENYIVMATGNCTDVRENAWLDSLAGIALPPDTLYTKSTPASSERMKTIHFQENNVHDFAWFADKRWVVRKDTVTIPGGAEPATTYAAFLPTSQKAWAGATEYLRATVHHYSDFVGAYPYKTIKAVEGDMSSGGGMEYPTVTVIDRGANAMLKRVLIHEAGHNWFYGIIATNERDHAWMDEGINTFYEKKTVQAMEKQGPSRFSKAMGSLEELLYFEAAASRTDQALEQTSARFTKLNYGMGVYQKTALMLEWLEQYMGTDQFRKAMRAYYETWKFRHPYPEDLQEILQQHTEKSIDWFFRDVLTTDQPVDFRIKQVARTPEVTEITVKNKTSFAAPVRIDAYQHDSLTGSVWSAPFSGTTTLKLAIPGSSWTRLQVAEEIPDIKPANSIYRKNGLFHKSGIKPGLFAGTNRGGQERIWLLPAVGYNQYDGLHLGLLLHNLTIPQTRFRFAVAPLYSLGSNAFTGAGSAGYVWYPKRVFHNILLQTDVKSFHADKANDYTGSGSAYARYLKIAPALHFTWKEQSLQSTVSRTLTLKGYSVREQAFDRSTPTAGLTRPLMTETNNNYGLLRYIHQNARTFNPFAYKFEMQAGEKFAKINLEGGIRIDYHMQNKALYVSGFAGKFIILNNATPGETERYWLNSTYTGVNDYLYDGTYIGRAENKGLAGNQISMQEGGFKIPTNRYASPLGRSDDWLATINVETDLPLVPLRLFFDAGSFSDAARINPSGNKLLFDGGVSLHLPFDILTVYFPLIMSKDFREYQKAMYGNKQLLNSIVFTIKLNNTNWLKAPSSLLKKIAG
jgi:hypothetical protein